MPTRKLPVRPDLDELNRQANDLLEAVHQGDPASIAILQEFHPRPPTHPGDAKLADAQLAIARSYRAETWTRLVLACQLIDAIWRDDLNAVREIVVEHPKLLHEHATIRDSNWGPPMSYAANLGRDGIIEMLHSLGAKDLEHAIGRAILQSKIGTARKLHRMMGSPQPPAGSLYGPAYTLSVSGTELVFELGAQVHGENGKCLAPVAVVLETDSRKPEAKHQILEMYAQHGAELPDTPVMAFHRGRIDLLEDHLRRDPDLLRRTFTHEEIYPPEWGCRAEVETQGTPLAGASLLHLCVDYDEIEIARWLLKQGMDVDTRAAVDAHGFGGYTALFGAVVNYANFWGNYRGELVDSPFARLLLERGANPNIRASICKRFDMENDRTVREYQNVTPISWGEQYHRRILVNAPAMCMIAEHGGHA